MLDRQYPSTPSALSGHWRYPCCNENWKHSNALKSLISGGIGWARFFASCAKMCLERPLQSKAFARALPFAAFVQRFCGLDPTRTTAHLPARKDGQDILVLAEQNMRYAGVFTSPSCLILPDIANCAAARRATGTRNGEQDT